MHVVKLLGLRYGLKKRLSVRGRGPAELFGDALRRQQQPIQAFPQPL
jgi:hypothetical protein